MSDQPIPFQPCSKCSTIKNTPPGYLWDDMNKLEDQRKLIRCKCKEKYDEYVSIFYQLKNNGFDTSIIDYDINTSYLGDLSKDECEKIKLFIEKFSDEDDETSKAFKRAILYIWGQRGTQKTSLSQFIGKELLKKGYSCIYTTIYKLVDLVSQLQDKDEQKIQKWLNCDLLIIDEFGNNYVTRSKYELPFVDNFIRERINKGKATLFVANDDIKSQSLIEKIGDNLQNFIWRNVELHGASLNMRDIYIQNAESYNKVQGLFGNLKTKRVAKING